MSPVGQENRSKHLTHRKSHFLTGTDFMPLTPPVSPTPTQTLFSTSCSDIFLLFFTLSLLYETNLASLLCVLNHFSCVCLRPHGLQLTRLLCPRDSPGKNTEWVALPSSRGSSQPGDWTCVSCVTCITGRFFTSEPPVASLPGRRNSPWTEEENQVDNFRVFLRWMKEEIWVWSLFTEVIKCKTQLKCNILLWSS